MKNNVLHIHGSNTLMTIELGIAKVYGTKKRIVHSHNTMCEHKKADKLLRHLFYHNYTKALTCGQDAGRWLYGKRPFDVIRNGKNVDKYKFDPNKRATVRKWLGLSEDVLVIGHVGNFSK